VYKGRFETDRSLAGEVCAGEREVARAPAAEEAPAALLLLELALDDGLAVGREEAQRALGVRAQEAAPRGVRRARAFAPRHLEHVEEARRAQLVRHHLLLLTWRNFTSISYFMLMSHLSDIFVTIS
jgi:hypothetical protein